MTLGALPDSEPSHNVRTFGGVVLVAAAAASSRNVAANTWCEDSYKGKPIMTKIILVAVTATVLLTAAPFTGTNPAQAQGVEIGPGGIRVDPDRRDRDYYRDRRDYRGGRRCRTEYTTRESPSGRMVREKKRCAAIKGFKRACPGPTAGCRPLLYQPDTCPLVRRPTE
jgi:hypothetical protein